MFHWIFRLILLCIADQGPIARFVPRPLDRLRLLLPTWYFISLSCLSIPLPRISLFISVLVAQQNKTKRKSEQDQEERPEADEENLSVAFQGEGAQ